MKLRMSSLSISFWAIPTSCSFCLLMSWVLNASFYFMRNECSRMASFFSIISMSVLITWLNSSMKALFSATPRALVANIYSMYWMRAR